MFSDERGTPVARLKHEERQRDRNLAVTLTVAVSVTSVGSISVTATWRQTPQGGNGGKPYPLV